MKLIDKLEKKKLTKKQIKNEPQDSGVYIFWNNGKALYVGKSNSLKNRLTSYFSTNLSPKTSQMINEAETFSTIRVNSELEALLLEAKLVSKFKAKYNVQLKDDKHPLYIKITDEKYPRVITARRKEKETSENFFGPFPSSKNVKDVLKMLRRIFPYSQHKIGKRRCIYSQMNLCNPCPSEIEKIENKNEKEKKRREYLRNIRVIKKILSGDLDKVRKNLVKNMDNYSDSKKFERAKLVKDKIDKLDYITQPITPISMFLKNPNLVQDTREQEKEELRSLLEDHIKIEKLERIECFDIAHLSGSFPTASMVTMINGEPDKSLYRHFKIRQKKGQDDISSMKEVAKRRAKHLADWGVPDLIIVDGGRGQVNAFLKIFGEHGIKVVGLAKRNEKLIIPRKDDGFAEVKVPKGNALNLIQRARDEAHRFARRYHHKLLSKKLTGDG